MRLLSLLLALTLVGTSCAGSGEPSPPASSTNESRPPGQDPPSIAGAFYYPWYGNPQEEGRWVHWTQNGHVPPDDIASDYYPRLGAYSSNDRAVVTEHMAWFRKAGIGIAITSWWGRGSYEDKAVPLLLSIAGQYGIKVAFHIEPYAGRTATSLVDDIRYLYDQYGRSPAFFRSSSAGRYSRAGGAKGLFFLWCVGSEGTCGARQVDAAYWRAASDAIHGLPDGALLIANTSDASWIDGAHFDGLYNYFVSHLDPPQGFGWARGLPPGALYVPSVAPGFSATRVGYPSITSVPRLDGRTYDDQWAAALGTGVGPEFITITSFNEWHEGTMIEPAATGRVDGNGYAYADYGAVLPEGYLSRSNAWVQRALAMTYPIGVRARVEVRTTSDWTNVYVVSGGAWMRPERVGGSAGTRTAGMRGDQIFVTQPLADASTGTSVSVTFDVQMIWLVSGGQLVIGIDRGNLGMTEVKISNYIGSSPVLVSTYTWSGVAGLSNTSTFILESASLLTQP